MHRQRGTQRDEVHSAQTEGYTERRGAQCTDRGVHREKRCTVHRGVHREMRCTVHRQRGTQRGEAHSAQTEGYTERRGAQCTEGYTER